MALTNSHALYGGISKTFHWLTALLIFMAFPLGMIANGLPQETSAEITDKAWLFSIHKTVGIATFFVALARILWAMSQSKPGLLNADNRAEATVADAVHWLLYFSLVLVPLSGWIHHAASEGFAPILWPFGDSLPLIPKSETLSHIASSWHFIFTKVLGFSLLLHIGGALKHAFIDRDETVKRMLPIKMETPNLPTQTHSKAPLLIAVVLYGIAIGSGVFLGQSSTSASPQKKLAAVQSDWTVQDGSLEITVQQLGSAVTGEFSDWTAEISFDPEAQADEKGHVEVTIAIGSLSIGSVTDQAMGPDFFDTPSFPTALFSADIIATGETYEARGSLTLKGQAIPVVLPFNLALADDSAKMTGSIQLARLDFNIGETMQDESSLGFSVDVLISLNASQQPKPIS